MGNELNGTKGDKGMRRREGERSDERTGNRGSRERESRRASESIRSGHSANRRINHPATH